MIYLLLVYAFIFLVNVPGLVKRKERKELVVFFILYIIGFVLGLMYALDIPVPSPMKGLDYLISDKMGIKYPKH